MNAQNSITSTQESKQNYAPAQKITEVINANEIPEQQINLKYLESFPIQRKLSIGAVDDPLEHEADAMADKVMRMPESNFIQRKCSQCGEEEKAQRKPLASFIQKKCAHCEEEEKAQRKPFASFIQKKSVNNNNSVANDSVSAQIQSMQCSGRPLHETTKSFMESRFGANFSNVNIHTGNYAVQMSRDLNAHAFTVGNNIYFNEGKYAPESSAGKHLLAHELTHTIQQGTSAYSPLVQRQPGDAEKCEVAEITTGQYFDPPKAHAGIDSQNIFIVVTWCRGDSLGDIKLGADVPAEATKIANKIVSSAQSGNLNNLGDDLKGENLTPFLDVIIKKGNFSITAHGELSVGVGGVKNIAADATIQWGDFQIKPFFSKDDTETKGGATVGYVPHPAKPECKAKLVPLKVYCNCTAPPSKGIVHLPPGSVTTSEEVYIHFKWAEYAEDKITPPVSDNAEVAKLHELLSRGFVVTELAGFTSPEGPLNESAHFQGNHTLSSQRAVTVKKMIEKYCSDLAAHKFAIDLCSKNVLKDFLVVKEETLGKNELYGSVDDKELKGKALDEHVVEEFMSNDAESKWRTQEFVESLKGLNTKQIAKKILPLLRRVKIKLERKSKIGGDVEIDLGPNTIKKECPKDIADAAKQQYMLTH